MREIDPNVRRGGYGRFWDIGGVVGVVGGLLGKSSADKAADAQAASADKATALQEKQFDTIRSDQMPYMQRGNIAANRLQMLLGLAPAQGGSASVTGRRTAADIRAELQATGVGRIAGAGAAGAPSVGGSGYDPAQGGLTRTEGGGGYGESRFVTPGATTGGAGGGFDEAALDAAVQQVLQQQNDEEQAAQTAAQADPQYGELTRRYTGAELLTDPGYQFGLSQGLNALQTTRAGQGALYSGAAAKALTRYGQDYAGTKFNEGFNRDQAYKNTTYNQLAGVAGTGQTAVNQVGAAGQAFGNAAAANTIGAGNARASSYIAGGNALQQALNTGVAAYQRYNPPQVIDDGYSYGQGGAYGGARAGL